MNMQEQRPNMAKRGTHDNPIKFVKAQVSVALPKMFIDKLRANSSGGFENYTDKQIVVALANDILDRYFHESYFDLEIF